MCAVDQQIVSCWQAWAYPRSPRTCALSHDWICTLCCCSDVCNIQFGTLWNVKSDIFPPGSVCPSSFRCTGRQRGTTLCVCMPILSDILQLFLWGYTASCLPFVHSIVGLLNMYSACLHVNEKSIMIKLQRSICIYFHLNFVLTHYLWFYCCAIVNNQVTCAGAILWRRISNYKWMF